MPPFVSGLELCRHFYWEAVRPVLDARFPDLRHAAALIGPGSEVLGFDSEMSTDHHWGPRAMLFLGDEDFARYSDDLAEIFRWQLPHSFLGYPTNFAQPIPEDPGTRLLKQTESGPIDHRVEVYTLRSFVAGYLGFDIDREISTADWLSFPQQRLRTLTGGAIYHDEVGLEEVRSRFAYYPRDLWLYMMAAGWSHIGQEEHLMGRAGFAGDELGSALIAARLVTTAMKLSFLMERQYAPYPKWFGTAFRRLQAGPALQPLLTQALAAASWPERADALAEVYEQLAREHNALGVTPPVPATTSLYWGRPFRVIWGGRVAGALTAEVRDGAVQQLLTRAPIGGIDQVTDSTDVLEEMPREILARLWA